MLPATTALALFVRAEKFYILLRGGFSHHRHFVCSNLSVAVNDTYF